MSDSYKFGLPIDLAPCLGLCDVYFLLQGLLNGAVTCDFWEGNIVQIS